MVSRILVGTALLALGHVAAADPGGARFIRYSMTIQNPANEPLVGRVWFYAPVTRTGVQKLERLEVNLPHLLVTDPAGNSVVELTDVKLAPFESRVVSVAAHLSLDTQSAAQALPDPQLLLRAERFIEVDDPQIRDMARQLRKPQPIESARAVYDWVRANIAYGGYDADEYGAKLALTRRRGDCTEFADLSAALLRAQGIPARVVGGYVVDRDTIVRAAEYHNWAEVYLNGAWRVLDAQKGVLAQYEDRYIAFHRVSRTVANAMEGAERFHSSPRMSIRME